MMDLDEIAAVSQNIEQGGWVKNLPGLRGVALKVRGTFNSDYNKLYAELRSELSPEDLKNPKVQEAVDIRLLHETILVDWDGIADKDAKPDKDGKKPPLKYSPEKALELLTSPKYAIFKRAVTYAGNVVAEEGAASLEDATKNS